MSMNIHVPYTVVDFQGSTYVLLQGVYQLQPRQMVQRHLMAAGWVASGHRERVATVRRPARSPRLHEGCPLPPLFPTHTSAVAGQQIDATIISPLLPGAQFWPQSLYRDSMLQHGGTSGTESACARMPRNIKHVYVQTPYSSMLCLDKLLSTSYLCNVSFFY